MANPRDVMIETLLNYRLGQAGTARANNVRPWGREHSEGRADAVLAAYAEAGLVVCADDGALAYARRLATALWERHWKADAPDWKPLPDLIGVLMQIDNMTAKLTRAALNIQEREGK